MVSHPPREHYDENWIAHEGLRAHGLPIPATHIQTRSEPLPADFTFLVVLKPIQSRGNW